MISDLVDKDFYQNHGYVFTSQIFSDEELDLVVEAQDRFYSGEHGPWPFKKIPLCGWKPGDFPGLRKNDYASLVIPEIKKLIIKPMLGKIAEYLCGEKVRLWQDQLSFKAAHDLKNQTSMGWHNDAQYWSSCSSLNMLTAWIPLEDMTIDMGPIMYLDQSHNWPAFKGMDFFSNDLPGLEKEISSRGFEIKKIPAKLKRGQVSFHHCRTLHASGSNTSSKDRRALAVHMQPVSNVPVKNQFHIAKLFCSELKSQSYDHPLLFPLLGDNE